MNSELMYSFLMGMGWFFLLSWAVTLLVTCAKVFKQDGVVELAGSHAKTTPTALRR